MALKALSKELHPSLGTYDGVSLLPDDLRPSPNFCGRIELEDIAKFKRDFLDPRIGQIQPISIWKNPQSQLAWIIDGVTRWRAGKEITDEKIGPHKDGTFRLKCLYLQCATEQDAFILTIKGNIRNDPSQASNIRNVAICRYNLGLEVDDIAGRVYGRFTLKGDPDTKWVDEMLALNNLAPEALKALSDGKLKSAAARALAKMTPDAQRERIKSAGDGNITAATLNGSAPTNGNGNGHKKPAWKTYMSAFEPYESVPVETPMARFARSLRQLEVTGDIEAHFAIVEELLGGK
jgi:hypothetical protein